MNDDNRNMLINIIPKKVMIMGRPGSEKSTFSIHI